GRRKLPGVRLHSPALGPAGYRGRDTGHVRRWVMRRTPLRARTPLGRYTPLRATGGLQARTPLARTAPLRPAASEKPRKAPRDTGPTRLVRTVVLERDG